MADDLKPILDARIEQYRPPAASTEAPLYGGGSLRYVVVADDKYMQGERRRQVVRTLVRVIVIVAFIGLVGLVGAVAFGGAGLLATSGAAAAVLPTAAMLKLTALIGLFPTKLAFVGACLAVGALVTAVPVATLLASANAINAIRYHRTMSQLRSQGYGDSPS